MNTENTTTTEVSPSTSHRDRPGVRLYASNIDFKLNYEDVAKALGSKAQIIDLTLPLDSSGKRNKGYALFRVSEADAEVLLTSTVILAGRILRIQPPR